MKMIRNLLSIAILLGSLYACSEEWDSHYQEKKQVVNNVNITVVDAYLLDYLGSESSLSSMYGLFEETGNIEIMKERDQLFTVLAVRNENINASSLDKNYLAKAHISDVALSPASLTDGYRILMSHNKYLTISKKESETEESIISFNGTKVTKIIKLNDGFIYELESYVNSPLSMYEVIEGLGDDYSIFRDLVLSKNERIFDKNASLPIGVDETGSTVYDSVFVVTNSYFSDKGMNLMSEALSATMLIPSNEVAQKAIQQAEKNLAEWRMERADSVYKNWIFQSAFFAQEYSKQDFIDNEDLTSVFGKQWRTTVQEVDLDNPISMSNGTAYYVKSMKIPTNVLIYRLKDYMKWYEFMSEEQKSNYFITENLLFNNLKTEVAGWSGWPQAGYPLIENRVLTFKYNDTEQPYSLEFTPTRCKDNGDGSYDIEPYLLPPGEYDFCLGFKQNLGADLDISFNGVYQRTITTSEFTSTTFHYDRGSGSYPEGYVVSQATMSNKDKYDRDGGRIATVVITGTEAKPVKITFASGAGSKNLILHHWCLKPTKNCY